VQPARTHSRGGEGETPKSVSAGGGGAGGLGEAGEAGGAVAETRLEELEVELAEVKER
jgi:hypothetical protein